MNDDPYADAWGRAVYPGKLNHEIAAEACTELGAKPDLLDRANELSTPTIWVLCWLLGGVAIGIPLGAIIALF